MSQTIYNETISLIYNFEKNVAIQIISNFLFFRVLDTVFFLGSLYFDDRHEYGNLEPNYVSHIAMCTMLMKNTNMIT